MLTVENWPIDKPLPYARNPRKISDKAVEKVASSIKEYGFRQPIVVDGDGVIVAGHTRLQAARKLGLEEVPVHVAADLTPEQAKAYRLADNRAGQEAEWDDDLLGLELGELQGLDFDLDLTAFDDEEIGNILAGLGAEPLEEYPDLPDGDKAPFQQMTFTLHDDQAEQVEAAISAAKALGPFVGPNENSNGNALARICEVFLGTAHGRG